MVTKHTSKSPQPRSESVWTANIVFVRHGFSTVNVLSHVSDLPVHEDYFEYIVDPCLTSIGVQATIHNGKRLSETLAQMNRFKHGFNMVLSSNLFRAIETAHYLGLTSNDVTVLPFLKETGPRLKNPQTGKLVSHQWNRPLDVDSQKRLLLRSGIRPKYDFMNESNWDAPSSILRFLKWFGEGGRFLLLLGKTLTPEQIKHQSFNIVVVSHGGVMTDFLQKYEPQWSSPPDNNEAYHGCVTYNQKGSIEKISHFRNVNYPKLFGVDNFPVSFQFYMSKDKRAISQLQNGLDIGLKSGNPKSKPPKSSKKKPPKTLSPKVTSSKKS